MIYVRFDNIKLISGQSKIMFTVPNEYSPLTKALGTINTDSGLAGTSMAEDNRIQVWVPSTTTSGTFHGTLCTFY